MECGPQFKKGVAVVQSRATWAGFGGPKCAFRMRYLSKVELWGASRFKKCGLAQKQRRQLRTWLQTLASRLKK